MRGINCRTNRLVRRKSFRFRRFSHDSYRNPGLTGLQHDTDSLRMLRHELRTPLSGVLGMIELLQDTRFAFQTGEFMKALRASARQMALLVDRMANPAACPRYQPASNEQLAPGRTFLEQLLLSHWPAASKRQTSLMLIGAESVNRLWLTDLVALRQALDNLLSNAIRFTFRGYVLLEVKQTSALPGSPIRLVITVEDSGSRFNRECSLPDGTSEFAENAYAPVKRGMGLGIVRNVCEQLHATFEYNYSNKDGSLFQIKLPGSVLGNPVLSRSISPAMLRKIHCMVQLREPQRRLAESLLDALEISFESTSEITDCGNPNLPAGTFLITHDAGMFTAGQEIGDKSVNEGSAAWVVAATGAPGGGPIALPLPEPLFLSGLEATLMRCALMQRSQK